MELTDIDVRYQVIVDDEEGNKTYGVYEVAVNPDTDEVIYVTSGVPIIEGTSVTEIITALADMTLDVKKYGVISFAALDGMDDDDDSDDEVDLSTLNYEDEISFDDNEYYDDVTNHRLSNSGRVIDLVEFMGGRA